MFQRILFLALISLLFFACQKEDAYQDEKGLIDSFVKNTIAGTYDGWYSIDYQDPWDLNSSYTDSIYNDTLILTGTIGNPNSSIKITSSFGNDFDFEYSTNDIVFHGNDYESSVSTVHDDSSKVTFEYRYSAKYSSRSNKLIYYKDSKKIEYTKTQSLSAPGASGSSTIRFYSY